MQRLRQNHGGYRGQGIDIHAVLDGTLAAADRHGWQVEAFLASPALRLIALHRRPPGARRRIYLSTGIHGDEPAGPLAICTLIEENRWPADLELCICPCLNPTGFPLNRRENADGIDLNRDYRHFETVEIRAHASWLKRQPAFDLAICLHEDWEAQGFYLYELNPERRPSLAEAAIKAVAPLCSIDSSPMIDGRAAAGGIIRPSLDPTTRARWPEAFYLVQTVTRHSYTLEAPSEFPLPARVAALVTGVRELLAES